MSIKNEKRKWYFLIAVALIVGAIIGYLATERLSTKGNANANYIENNNDYDYSEIRAVSKKGCKAMGGTVSWLGTICFIKGEGGKLQEIPIIK